MQDKALDDSSVQVALEANVAGDVAVCSALLAVGDSLVVVVFAIVGEAVSVGTEVRAPAPDVGVSTASPHVLAVIFLLREVDVGTCTQPREDFGRDVGTCVVAAHLVGSKSHKAFAAVVACREAVCSLAGVTVDAHVVLLRRSSAVEHDVLNVPVGIVHSSAGGGILIEVTHVVHALEWAHHVVATLLAAILLIPSLSVGEHLVEIHTEELVVNALTVVGLHECTNLVGH